MRKPRPDLNMSEVFLAIACALGALRDPSGGLDPNELQSLILKLERIAQAMADEMAEIENAAGVPDKR